MYFNILKKDLKRKKSMNFILLLFVILAVVFATSSISNLIAVLGGSDDYFDIAGIEDFFIVTMQRENDMNNNEKIKNFLEGYNDINYTSDNIIYFAKNNITFANGKDIEMSDTGIINSFDIQQQKFFDSENNIIDKMAEGTIYLSGQFMAKNNINSGDKITISDYEGYKKEFEVIGNCKDALLGSELLGVNRFIINSNDFNDIYKNSGFSNGELYSIRTTKIDNFVKDFNNGDFTVIFSCTRELVKNTYIMDIVIALILFGVSICLIFISVIMLRFIIVFTIDEEYKEIGIMKAIGMNDSSIRSLYIVKYFAISAVGAFIGFIAAVPFGNMLIKQVSENIIMKSGGSMVLLQFLISLFLVFAITVSAYISTRKIKKLTPMDTIRNGNIGERFNKKSIMHMHKSRMKVTSFIAFNDVLIEIKKYIVILFTGMVGIWLVAMAANTINTLNSDEMYSIFSLLDCDLCIADNKGMMEIVKKQDKGAVNEYLSDVKKILESAGIKTKRVFIETMFRYRIRKGDNSYKSIACKGINTSASEYEYIEGSAPAYADEVALAYVTAEAIDAGIGDTVYISMYDEEKQFIVSALYQSFNNMGEGIRFHEDTDIDFSYMSGTYCAQVEYAAGTDKNKADDYFEKAKKVYRDAKVQTISEYVSSMLGSVTDRISSLKVMILTIVIIINVLIIVLMQKTCLIRDKASIGMMKSFGFSDRDIIGWQTKRVAVVSFVGMLIGVFTGTPFSKITSGKIFAIMGAKQIQFVVNPLEIFVVYPVIIFAFTVLACVFTMRSIKKIQVQEITSME